MTGFFAQTRKDNPTNTPTNHYMAGVVLRTQVQLPSRSNHTEKRTKGNPIPKSAGRILRTHG